MKAVGFDTNDVQHTKTDAALGADLVGERSDCLRGAFEDHRFQTVAVI